jgi:hypothetical protein
MLATCLLRTHLVDKLWDFYVCYCNKPLHAAAKKRLPIVMDDTYPARTRRTNYVTSKDSSWRLFLCKIYVFTTSHFEWRKQQLGHLFKCIFQVVGGFGGAVAAQAPFTSEFVSSILATDSCEKSQSTLCRKSWVFSGCSQDFFQDFLLGPFLQRRLSLAEQLGVWGGCPPPPPPPTGRLKPVPTLV